MSDETSWSGTGEQEPPGSATRRYDYRAYGLHFRSTLPLPELSPVEPESLAAKTRPDVVVRTGKAPDSIEGGAAVGSKHEVAEGQLLLRIDGVGAYLVTDGTEILVQPEPGAAPHDVRVYLLGSCLGALLHQRGFLVLHAAGIGTEHGAVLFAGKSGSGKSTLLGALLRRGHRMLVDDVCAVDVPDGRRPAVVPSYPRTRLWADTARRLDIDTTDLPRTRSDMDKYERQVPDQFWDQPAPLRRIYVLASDGDELSLMPLGPTEAFHTVLGNTYRSVLLGGLGRRGLHFELSTRVARSVPVTGVVRPRDGFRVEELADLILEDLEAPARGAPSAWR